MSTTRLIAFRELASFFRLPVGWVVIALYLLLAGGLFAWLALTPGEPASMRIFFSLSAWLLLPVAPAISMRLFSEEFRAGTMEPLQTSPATDSAIVVGKFIGGFFFLIAMLTPTIAYPIVLHQISSPAPDPGPILAGYASLLLAGGLYLAIGLFASSLTSNQTLAYIVALLAILIVLLGAAFAPENPAGPIEQAASTLASALSISKRLGEFAKGVVSLSSVIFFVSGIVWFVVLTIVSVQSRRWR